MYRETSEQSKLFTMIDSEADSDDEPINVPKQRKKTKKRKSSLILKPKKKAPNIPKKLPLPNASQRKPKKPQQPQPKKPSPF